MERGGKNKGHRPWCFFDVSARHRGPSVTSSFGRERPSLSWLRTSIHTIPSVRHLFARYIFDFFSDSAALTAKGRRHSGHRNRRADTRRGSEDRHPWAPLPTTTLLIPYLFNDGIDIFARPVTRLLEGHGGFPTYTHCLLSKREGPIGSHESGSWLPLSPSALACLLRKEGRKKKGPLPYIRNTAFFFFFAPCMFCSIVLRGFHRFTTLAWPNSESAPHTTAFSLFTLWTSLHLRTTNTHRRHSAAWIHSVHVSHLSPGETLAGRHPARQRRGGSSQYSPRSRPSWPPAGRLARLLSLPRTFWGGDRPLRFSDAGSPIPFCHCSHGLDGAAPRSSNAISNPCVRQPRGEERAGGLGGNEHTAGQLRGWGWPAREPMDGGENGIARYR